MSGGTTIKIPSEKQRRADLELKKLHPFHPSINKKSTALEKVHNAKFFERKHKHIIDLTTA